MIFTIQPHEKRIFRLVADTAAELGVSAYVVGGYVRDRLLARPSKDMDIVCIGSGIELAEKLAQKLSPLPKVVVYQRFGTAMLRYNDMEIEFVGARRESYRPDSRKPSVENGTLEDDQNRRDFTINALAVSLNKDNFGEIIDPFNGLEDLERKRLITPLEAGKTFSDDPLRMMRGIRFAAQLGFTLDENTLKGIATYRNRIDIVSAERITTELEKIMMTDKPSIGLKLLMETGLLAIIFPELDAMKGRQFQNGQGHKDNFFHTLQVLDNLCRNSKNLWLRWAALLHDIGKPATKRFEEGNGWTFHGHEALGAAMVPRIFKRLRLSMGNEMKYVQKLVQLHQRPISLTKEEITDSAIRRILMEAGEDIDDLMLLCEADITSKNEAKVSNILKNYEFLRAKMLEIEEKDQLRNWQPPITGELIMEIFGISPSQQVGIIKNHVREAILEGHIGNDYESAYQLMLEKGKELGFMAKN